MSQSKRLLRENVIRNRVGPLRVLGGCNVGEKQKQGKVEKSKKAVHADSERETGRRVNAVNRWGRNGPLNLSHATLRGKVYYSGDRPVSPESK